MTGGEHASPACSLSEADPDYAFAPVMLTQNDGWALIRLNRPDQRNAMNRAARAAFAAALERVKGTAKVVVVTGADPAFCAGIDLKERAADTAAGIVEGKETEWSEVCLSIRAHPAVFIAAVNGIALGGGTTLVNTCDLAIAAEEASFGMPEVGFGIYPAPAGPAAQLTLTRKRAAWLALTTERIDGRTAEAWGLVNRVVPKADLLAAAEDLARRIARFDAAALGESKRALDLIPGTDWAAAFAAGGAVNERIRNLSDAGAAGIARFARGERNAGQG